MSTLLFTVPMKANCIPEDPEGGRSVNIQPKHLRVPAHTNLPAALDWNLHGIN